MDILGAQLVNGLSYGLLLFIITCGLTLIFGILGVLNLSHGSFYMVGAYIAYSLTATYTQSFWMALIIAPIAVGVLALVVELFLLRPTYQLGHLSQVLLTFGLAYIIHDLSRMFWGSNVLSVSVPAIFTGSISIFGQTFPAYRLAIILLGLVLAAVLWLVQEKTKWGAIIRAGLSDKEMVSALGINIKVVFTAVFVLGGLLAGLGGVISAPILGIYPNMEFETLILALVVLVIGGLGSISGTFVASILVGVAETFGRYLFPELSMFIVFGLMAIILIVKPSGLLGKQVNPDHSGLAGYMQELTGAEVWMSETDRAMFERAFVKNKEQAVHVEHMLSKHGTPTELIKAILENLENITAHVQPFATIQAIKEKEWNLGRKRWKIYGTPGHSQGHLCFFQEDEKVLLSADMILDTITPNISLWPGGSQRPLEDYLSSLNRLKQLSAKEVWPGHGGVIQDVAKRIDELTHHHEVRLNKIAELASDQTGYEIAESLFAEKNLTSHQWRFAIGETLAHLEYLADQARIQRINADPIRFAG